MPVEQYLLIAAGLLVFSLLMFAGAAASNRNKKKAEAERIAEEKRKMLQAEPPKPAEAPALVQAAVLEPENLPQAAGTGSGPSAGPDLSAGLEILRISRRPFDGGLNVGVMGKTAEHVGDMTPGQVAQLKQLVREIAMWVEGKSGSGGAAASAPAPVGGASMPSPADQPLPAGSSGAASTASEPPAPEPPAPPAAPPIAFAETLPRVPEARDMMPFRKKNIPKLGEAPEPPRPIVVQIDELLQGMLGASPLAGHEIRLSEDLGGGLKIVHDGKTYPSIDDVADPEVKALIKKAVQTWNERNKLG